MVETPTDKALTLLSQPHLHQHFWLPQTEIHEKLRVTFSTTSNFDNASLPVILFCGPMFGSRYLNLLFDAVAKREGVRVVIPDRPGLGASTPVPLPQRLAIWLETVPALLSHLHLSHFSALLSHSAGTSYLLNTLYHLPQILNPEAPYAALLGPWVSQTHTSKNFLKAAALLPEEVLGQWSVLAEFMNTKVAPVGAWSGGISGGIISSLSGLWGAENGEEAEEEERVARVKYGVDRETAKEIERLWTKFTFAEQGMAGATDEMKLCLGRGGEGSLGICEDYEVFVERLVKQLKDGKGGRKVKIDVMFAEKDNMIGEAGREYFKKCWNKEGVEEVLDMQFEVRKGTDHESVLGDVEKGGVKEVFERVARMGRDG